MVDSPVIVNSCVQSRAVIEYRFSHGDLGIEILNSDLAMRVWEYRYLIQHQWPSQAVIARRLPQCLTLMSDDMNLTVKHVELLHPTIFIHLVFMLVMYWHDIWSKHLPGSKMTTEWWAVSCRRTDSEMLMCYSTTVSLLTFIYLFSWGRDPGYISPPEGHFSKHNLTVNTTVLPIGALCYLLVWNALYK